MIISLVSRFKSSNSKVEQKEIFDLIWVEHSQGMMELIRKNAFECHHKEFFLGNPDRGFFEKKTLQHSIDQNLGKLLVVGMIVVLFAILAAKVSFH